MLWLKPWPNCAASPFCDCAAAVGSGPFLNEVIAARRRLGLDDLEIRQFLTRPEEIYGEADALLLMSRVEGTPNVVIEAQACGLAVAASDVGGVAGAILREGPAAGLLLDPDLAPAAAAGALAEWLPRALSAAPDTRRRFVQDRFDLAVLGATACALYGEPGGRP
ncbi:MAG: glycosyltransferase [Paracoccaceae bacterium]